MYDTPRARRRHDTTHFALELVRVHPKRCLTTIRHRGTSTGHGACVRPTSSTLNISSVWIMQKYEPLSKDAVVRRNKRVTDRKLSAGRIRGNGRCGAMKNTRGWGCLDTNSQVFFLSCFMTVAVQIRSQQHPSQIFFFLPTFAVRHTPQHAVIDVFAP